MKTLLKTFQAKLFGTKSEKSTSVDENQLRLWDDDSVFTWSEHTDKQSTESPQEKIQKSQKRRKKRQKQIEGLEIVKNVKRLKETACPSGQALKVVGEKFVGKKLHYKAAELWVVEEYVEIYACDCADCLAKNNGQTAFFNAEKSSSLFAHSLATPTLLENIVYQKYVLGTPLYRQLKDWHRFGWNVCEPTLAVWVIQGADKLRSLYDLLHKKLLQRPYLHYLQGDETVVKVLREPGKSLRLNHGCGSSARFKKINSKLFIMPIDVIVLKSRLVPYTVALLVFYNVMGIRFILKLIVPTVWVV